MKTYVLIPMIEHTQNSIPRSMPLKAMMAEKPTETRNKLFLGEETPQRFKDPRSYL